MDFIACGASSLQDLLDAREERWRRRLELSRRGTLLTLTLNMPGPDKSLPRWLEFYSAVRDDIFAATDWGGFVHAFSGGGPAGPEDHFLFPVSSDAKEIKRAAVDFEERYPARRLIDLDVMAFGGEPVDRDMLALPLRACLCCPRPAKECAALARHPADEVMKAAERLLDAFEDISR